jgi:hypothetical protein
MFTWTHNVQTTDVDLGRRSIPDLRDTGVPLMYLPLTAFPRSNLDCGSAADPRTQADFRGPIQRPPFVRVADHTPEALARQFERCALYLKYSGLNTPARFAQQNVLMSGEKQGLHDIKLLVCAVSENNPGQMATL